MRVTLYHPWLVADLGAPHRVLSWAVHRPGLVIADRIVWRGVREADLTESLDPAAWVAGEMADAGHGGAVGLITSRDVAHYHRASAMVEDVRVDCLATVGLSNTERVGARRTAAAVSRHDPVKTLCHRPRYKVGTVNIAVRCNCALTEAAMLEAVTVAVEARTLAILDAGRPAPGGVATGTGTDCVALAAPTSGPVLGYAGLHTAMGEAVGKAVLAATGAGVGVWLAQKAAGVFD